jgi:hypothetical protein
MSALWAPVADRPEPQEEPAAHRPTLRALPAGLPRLARVPFILVLIGVFGLGMTGLLMLNTTLQNQAFQASTLSRQATELAYTRADLESQLDRQAAPQVLAQRASALGLRANPYPAFLVVPKGKVVGKPEAVRGNEMPALVIKTPAQLAAERAAAAARKQAKALQAVADARAKALAARQAAAAKQVADAQRAAAAKQAAADAKKAAAEAKKNPTSSTAAQKKTAQKKTTQKNGSQTGGRG